MKKSFGKKSKQLHLSYLLLLICMLTLALPVYGTLNLFKERQKTIDNTVCDELTEAFGVGAWNDFWYSCWNSGSPGTAKMVHKKATIPNFSSFDNTLTSYNSPTTDVIFRTVFDNTFVPPKGALVTLEDSNMVRVINGSADGQVITETNTPYITYPLLGLECLYMYGLCASSK